MQRRTTLLGPIILFIISLFLIIIGAILTASIVFFFIGLPLLIIGVLMSISSIFLFISTLIGKVNSLFSFPEKRKKQKVIPKIKKRKGKIIDVKEKEGVYEPD